MKKYGEIWENHRTEWDLFGILGTLKYQSHLLKQCLLPQIPWFCHFFIILPWFKSQKVGGPSLFFGTTSQFPPLHPMGSSWTACLGAGSGHSKSKNAVLAP